MSQSATITLQADAQPLLNCLQGITADLSNLEGLVEAPLEIADGLVDFGSFAPELRCVDLGASAAGAVEVLVTVEPGDSLRVLSAALGARKFDGLVVEK
ncbi:hypothetical protein [Microbulbifer sp. SAOS-129_SWC]|uniref:hypothetical protein n=1 Tax=Microbulbifer sp. SAOS-129_SWC TaxID=3145235 RepID=UPI003216254C